MVTQGTRKQYLTRGKTNATAEIQDELFDNTLLCLTALNPNMMEATPICSTMPTPRTPSTPPGLLGEVFSRRRSTPTPTHGALTPPVRRTSTLSVLESPAISSCSKSEQCNPATTAPSTLVTGGHAPVTATSVDILDNISTQTLNNLLHGESGTASPDDSLANILDGETDTILPEGHKDASGCATPTTTPHNQSVLSIEPLGIVYNHIMKCFLCVI